ncbi:MAG: DEAD/DEAH box helicase family protein [bacterium]|nr:DEAD/DEAH box helicase family protein [bacterium]
MTEESTRPRRRRSRSHKSAPAGPVPLHKRSSSHFQPSERDHGTESFQEGQVRLEIEGMRAKASVEESERDTYRVGVDWTRVGKRRLHTFCECPRFASGELCRHIWAVLLALAETGPENQPPGKDRLGLRRDRAASWEDLGVSADRNEVRVIHSVEPASGGQGARPARSARARSSSGRRRGAATSWRSQLASLRDEITTSVSPPAMIALPVRPAPSIHFFINTAVSNSSGSLVLDVFGSTQNANGKQSKMKRLGIEPHRLEELLLPRSPGNGSSGESDESLALITELSADSRRRKASSRRGPNKNSDGIRRLRLPQKLYEAVLPHLCNQGKLGWWDGRVQSNLHPLWWDAGTAWHLALHLDVNASGGARLHGHLEREGETVPLKDPVLLLVPGGSDSTTDKNGSGPSLVVFAESIGRLALEAARDLPWLNLLRNTGEIVIPTKDVEEALTEMLELPALPRFEIPEELELEGEDSPPQPRLVLEPAAGSARINPPLEAELSFDYGSLRVGAEDSRSSVVDWQERTLLRRDQDSEYAALVRLLELGFQPVAAGHGNVQALEINPRELPRVVEPLLVEGWTVEVQGKSVSPPSPPTLRVESGIDWFDLSGQVDFAGDRLELTTILDAVKRGNQFVDLADGSQGLLPAAWMETYDSLAQLASDATDDGLRFLPSQALIVDALLTAMPPADVDAAFAKLRDKLKSFERIKPKKETRGFGGTLREYQRRGLGWLNFLREFDLGGVLADDMGLGKTVQVLALIQAYRAPSKTTKLPFLVVAPRSVVYNWIDEASHFTPKLKVVEYRGPGREKLQEHFSDYDVIVTTYGTLRRDIGFLATVEFDTAILDEAQAIKNPASQTAKASRLLVARHRLALTGTPIENHLGELGSLFEFLNPGLLGRLPRLEVLTGGRAPSKLELEHIAEDMRPFILRRTKAQVLPDLPPKTEQTLLCNLRQEQRELYDKVRASYQVNLLEQVEEKGVSGSAIQVLEALLRLRQIACHPGLVNPEWEEAGSAKLETLFDQVSEVLDEGHKVLVFSQFTKLLAYVRRHLDTNGASYAYLDGKTRDRGKVVERFQTDPDCNLFLVSLKAGGTGLNLTAAGYVFLLDPWWNPAVEAQAIDRTHRIGQTQPVFAYRMIARDTVEEKILDLQGSKRKLADAILEGGGGQSLRDLTADDLKMLLS